MGESTQVFNVEVKCKVVMFIVVLVFILISAVVLDYRTGNIPNYLNVLGILLGIGYQFLVADFEGVLFGVVAGGLTFLILYPVYFIGGLGAGDVKLFAVTGVFFGIYNQMICLGAAFVIGAVISIVKLFFLGSISFSNIRERIYYFFSYIFDVIRTGGISACEFGAVKVKRTRIHFAIAILGGAIVTFGVAFIKGGML